MDNKITGSCYCGKVHFALKNDPKLVVNCHCDDCKKRNGAAFSTYIAVDENDFVLTKGGSNLKQYKIENVGSKYFCSECGSPIYNENSRLPGLCLAFYGAFSIPTNFNPNFNVFCSTKHSWVDTINSIPSFQESIEKLN